MDDIQKKISHLVAIMAEWRNAGVLLFLQSERRRRKVIFHDVDTDNDTHYSSKEPFIFAHNWLYIII